MINLIDSFTLIGMTEEEYKELEKSLRNFTDNMNEISERLTEIFSELWRTIEKQLKPLFNLMDVELAEFYEDARLQKEAIQRQFKSKWVADNNQLRLYESTFIRNFNKKTKINELNHIGKGIRK